MKFDECVKTRRSVRKYINAPLDETLVLECIAYAQLAPSWKNAQTTRFYVALNQKKQELMECLPSFNQNNVKDASALVVVTAVTGKSGFEKDGSFSTHLKEGFQYFDAGLATQNFCLKATDMGLGTLIMGLYDEPKIRAFFTIDTQEEIIAVVGLGIPAGDVTSVLRKEISEICTIKK